MHDPRFIAVVLHEDVIPNLNVAVAIFIWTAGRAARDFWAVIIEDFGAWTTGPGIAHHPKVIGGIARALVIANANNALGRHTNHGVPNGIRLIILGVNRY